MHSIRRVCISRLIVSPLPRSAVNAMLIDLAQFLSGIPLEGRCEMTHTRTLPPPLPNFGHSFISAS